MRARENRGLAHILFTFNVVTLTFRLQYASLSVGEYGAVQLETVTFWHPAQGGGGVPVASSAVGLAPLDAAAAAQKACAFSGYLPPTGMNRNTLAFEPAPTANPVDAVKHVKASYSGCARCHLCSTRSSVVFDRGNARSPLVFMGEGPGREENDLAVPFIGRSGKLQDEMCRQVDMDPEMDVFWMNVLGCRAAEHWKEDRPPSDPELIACAERTYLLLQAVRPRVIVCLGKVATRYFFDEPPPVWSWTQFTPQGAPNDWIMVGYAHHPAYLVRVVGAPAMYKEFAAQRTFYTMLSEKLKGLALSKVERWLFLPRYLARLQADPVVAWANGSSTGKAREDEDEE